MLEFMLIYSFYVGMFCLFHTGWTKMSFDTRKTSVKTTFFKRSGWFLVYFFVLYHLVWTSMVGRYESWANIVGNMIDYPGIVLLSVNKSGLQLFCGSRAVKNRLDIGFITNLFAPFNKSLTAKFLQWEFHWATTWPLSCKSDLERNANFAGTDEYFKLYGHSRRSLWKILSNLLHI